MKISMQRRARWYVYELLDGRTGDVFYVGKGCGNRMFSHEKDARQGTRSRKLDKIRAIKADGSQVVAQQVAFFWDEQAAYDHETDHIESYGLCNLTNVLPGGQKAWERRQVERAARRGKVLSAVEIVLQIAGYVAYWLRATNGGKAIIVPVFEGGDPRLTKARNQIAKTAWSELMPDLWKRAIASRSDWPKLSSTFLKYGIELRLGVP